MGVVEGRRDVKGGAFRVGDMCTGCGYRARTLEGPVMGVEGSSDVKRVAEL